MKKLLIGTVAVLAAVSVGVGVTGCSAEEEEPAAKVEIEGNTAEAAAFFVEEYFDLGRGFTKADYEIYSEAMGIMDMSIMEPGEQPFDVIKKQSKEETREMNKRLDKVNYWSELIDYKGMDDPDRATLNVFMIFMGSLLSQDLLGESYDAAFPSEGVTVTGEEAVANLEYLGVYLSDTAKGSAQSGEQSGDTQTGEELIPLGMTDNDQFYLKFVKDSWKIDGIKTLEHLRTVWVEEAESNQAMSGEEVEEVVEVEEE